MSKKSTAIVKEEEKNLAVYDYGDDAGSGYEHQTKADTSIPFIVLLQAMSPKVVEGDAKAGHWLNTATEEVYEEFYFVPATTRHFFAEWTPRDQGGGFHGHYEVSDPVVAEAIKNATTFGKNKLDNGNELVETFYVHGILCDKDGDPVSMAVVGFKSTAIRSYKTWNTRMKQFMAGKPGRPPLYAHLSLFKSESKKNDKGVFYVPKVAPANGGIKDSLLAPDDPRFLLAKSCKELVDSGDARIDPNQQSQDGEAETGAPF